MRRQALSVCVLALSSLLVCNAEFSIDDATLFRINFNAGDVGDLVDASAQEEPKQEAKVNSLNRVSLEGEEQENPLPLEGSEQRQETIVETESGEKVTDSSTKLSRDVTEEVPNTVVMTSSNKEK